MMMAAAAKTTADVVVVVVVVVGRGIGGKEPRGVRQAQDRSAVSLERSTLHPRREIRHFDVWRKGAVATLYVPNDVLTSGGCEYWREEAQISRSRVVANNIFFGLEAWLGGKLSATKQRRSLGCTITTSCVGGLIGPSRESRIVRW